MKIHGGHGCSMSAANPGRIFMLTALLLPPSPEGGSHNLSLRLMSPLTAQVKRKGGEGNEERMEEGESSQGWRHTKMISHRCIIGSQFITLTFAYIHKPYLCSGSTAVWSKAALLHRGFVEYVFDVRGRGKRVGHTIWIK